MALFRRRRPLRGGSPGHCRPRSFRHHRATTDQTTGARASRRRTHRARKMPTGTDGIFFGSGRCTTVCKRDDNGCGPRGSWFLFVISTRKSPPPAPQIHPTNHPSTTYAAGAVDFVRHWWCEQSDDNGVRRYDIIIIYYKDCGAKNPGETTAEHRLTVAQSLLADVPKIYTKSHKICDTSFAAADCCGGSRKRWW